ncbi:Nucleolar MIF4G domain-containing protein 1, partial [Coemansia sp. RSA 1836]
MSQKRKLKQNTDLPAVLATKFANDSAAGSSAGGDGRFKKRFKNGAATRKQARKQAREDKKQRKNVSHKRAHGHVISAPPPGKGGAAPSGRGAQRSSVAKKEERKIATPRAKPPVAKKVVTEAEERERLMRFAKRNQGMYQLLRDSNLVDNVDKEAGIVSSRDSAEDLEDRELRRLERNLGIKSNSKLASAFYDEGLGELFDGISFGSKDVQQKSQDPIDPRAVPAPEVGSEPESDQELDLESDAESDADANSDDEDDISSDSDGGVEDDSEDEGDDAFGLNDFGSDGDGSGSESEDSDIAEMYKSQGIDTNPELAGEYSEADDFSSADSDLEDSAATKTDLPGKKSTPPSAPTVDSAEATAS